MNPMTVVLDEYHVRGPNVAVRAAQGLIRGANSLWRSYLHAKLYRVLDEMSDAKLKAIGIRRDEISAYAHRLIDGD